MFQFRPPSLAPTSYLRALPEKALQPATALAARARARAARRPSWARAWLGAGTVIVPPMGMNVPGAGQ